MAATVGRRRPTSQRMSYSCCSHLRCGWKTVGRVLSASIHVACSAANDRPTLDKMFLRMLRCGRIIGWRIERTPRRAGWVGSSWRSTRDGRRTLSRRVRTARIAMVERGSWRSRRRGSQGTSGRHLEPLSWCSVYSTVTQSWCRWSGNAARMVV